MTTILYIILGISIGVGCTLIFLQERFIRERRLGMATNETERKKTTKQLRDLDEQWEAECEQYKQELAAMQAEYTEDNLLINESQIADLNATNKQLQENILAVQAQLTEVQNESEFLKGEIKRLEDENKNLPLDDFIVLSPPGGHLLPGSVARSLMKKKNS